MILPAKMMPSTIKIAKSRHLMSRMTSLRTRKWPRSALSYLLKRKMSPATMRAPTERVFRKAFLRKQRGFVQTNRARPQSNFANEGDMTKMAEITASMVKELRVKSGAAMMDCKKALVETSGDFDKAFEWLRQKGAATASKKASRATSEGIVCGKVSADGKQA